ncbi:MAG: hypothetical protein NTZ97_00485 [Candidatus Moranbacteria bacterium]|nr:hypothetical protein [Candidatus Moranbacteria bacterium]
MRLLIFLKRNKYFLLGFLVLVWVIFINLFPRGYVFGGGDTTQFINLKENYWQLLYDWNGSAAFFYFIFFVLDKIGFSNSIQLSFHLGFIIFGAYISFWIFSKILFKSASDLSRTLVSLFYALNLYTLFLFTGNWGYSYFPSLYVFIPILIGLFVKFIKTEKIIYGIFFALILFLASSGFGNPAFALSFALFIFTLTLCLIIFGYINPAPSYGVLNSQQATNFPGRCGIKLSWNLTLKIFAIALLSILASLFWILPLISFVKSGLEGLNTSNILDFDLWLRKSASPILNTLSLLNFTGDHFPLNFYYKNFSGFKNLFILISFIPIILIFCGLWLSKKFKNKILFFSLSALLAISTFGDLMFCAVLIRLLSIFLFCFPL